MAATMSSNYWTATAFYTMPFQQQEHEEEARWNQHKYGLCPICKTGLDDKADFTFNYASGTENGIMMCFDCDAKLNN